LKSAYTVCLWGRNCSKGTYRYTTAVIKPMWDKM